MDFDLYGILGEGGHRRQNGRKCRYYSFHAYQFFSFCLDFRAAAFSLFTLS